MDRDAPPTGSPEAQHQLALAQPGRPMEPVVAPTPTAPMPSVVSPASVERAWAAVGSPEPPGQDRDRDEWASLLIAPPAERTQTPERGAAVRQAAEVGLLPDTWHGARGRSASVDGDPAPQRTLRFYQQASGTDVGLIMVDLEPHRVLGRGTYGTVRPAWDTDESGQTRQLVVKEGNDRRRTMEQEFVTGVSLQNAYGREQSPLPRILGYDRDTDSLVMERAQGITYEQALQHQEHRLPINQMLPCMRDLAGSLLSLQERGYTMTDVNQGNIRVRDDRGRVEFLGFYDHGSVVPTETLSGSNPGMRLDYAAAFTDTNVLTQIAYDTISPQAAGESLHVAAVMAHLKDHVTGKAFETEGGVGITDLAEIERAKQNTNPDMPVEHRLMHETVAAFLGQLVERHMKSNRGQGEPVSLASVHRTLTAMVDMCETYYGR